MSTGTITLAGTLPSALLQATVPSDRRQVAGGLSPFPGSGQMDAWSQLRQIARWTLMSDQPDRRESPSDGIRYAGILKVLVTSGMAVSEQEYQERFAGMDLKHLRERMGETAFSVFVRYAGALRGQNDLDVTALTAYPRQE